MPKKKRKQKPDPTPKTKGQVPCAVRVRIVQAVMRGEEYDDYNDID